jgi:lipoyl-dependent peroxiredoxin
MATGTERTAEVTWNGDLMGGSGTIERVGSGAFGPLTVTWAARAEEPGGQTSPEELIAAAHAACFCMALSHALAQAGTPPEHISSTARVTFVPGTGITRSALDVEGTVPGIDEPAFRDAAEQAKEDCPVSQALKGNVELTVTARLRATAASR